MVRDSTTKNNIGKTEGIFFVVSNFSWLIGPFVGGIIAQAYGFKAMFFISGLFCFVSFFLSSNKSIKFKIIKNETKGEFFKNFKDYFKNKELAVVYLLSVALAFWWVFIYTYTPLYLISLGEKTIGYVLFALVIPLLILEIPVGRLADKWSYKWLMFIGFSLMSFIALLLYLNGSLYFYIILIILGSLGAAMIEPLREAYLFKIIKIKDERRFLTIFRTGYEIGYLAAPLIYSFVLINNGTNYTQLFLIIAIIIFLFGLTCLFLKEHNRLKKRVIVSNIKKYNGTS